MNSRMISKSFALLMVLASVFSVYAENVEKTYEKLIGRYDVANTAKEVEKDSLAAFWRAVYYGNEELLLFNMNMRKNRGAEKETVAKTKELPRFHPQYDESIIEGMQGFCDSLLREMKIADIPLECTLHVVYSDDVKAFTALTDDGFAICLTTALIGRKGINPDLLMGFVAHEFAHGMLQHHTRALYDQARQRRKDNLLGGVAIGAVIAAAGVSAVAEPSIHPPYPHDPVIYIDDAVLDKLAQKEDVEKISTSKYEFLFQPEQEYEADLVAYRFLEKRGCAGEYLNGLRILESADIESYDDDSNSPTPTSRIEFLKYVDSHPTLGNKVNARLRARRLGEDN